MRPLQRRQVFLIKSYSFYQYVFHFLSLLQFLRPGQLTNCTLDHFISTVLSICSGNHDDIIALVNTMKIFFVQSVRFFYKTFQSVSYNAVSVLFADRYAQSDDSKVVLLHIYNKELVCCRSSFSVNFFKIFVLGQALFALYTPRSKAAFLEKGSK